MPTATTGDFSASTYATAADAAARTLLDSADSTQELGNLQPLSATSSAGNPSAGSLLDIQAYAVRRFIRQHGREQAQAVATENVPCDTGNLVVTFTYANEDAPTRGDKLTITSAGCVISGGAISGSILMTVDQFTDASTGTSARFGVTFNDFGTSTAHVNGAASLQFDANSQREKVTVQFLGMTATRGSAQSRWFHSVTIENTLGGGAVLSYGGFLLGSNGYYLLNQEQPFVLDVSTGYPASGVLRVSDAQGDYLKIVARGDRFGYEFYVAGNTSGVPNATAEGWTFVPH